MKYNIAFFLSILMCSCVFTKTYQNRKEDKQKAEVFVEKFYSFIKDNNYDDALPLFNDKNQKKDEILVMLKSRVNKFGNVKGINLQNSRSKVIERDDIRTGEYNLTYSVKREREILLENFKVTSIGDTMKILSYSFEPQKYK